LRRGMNVLLLSMPDSFERAVRDANRYRRHVLERVRHRQQQDVHTAPQLSRSITSRRQKRARRRSFTISEARGRAGEAAMDDAVRLESRAVGLMKAGDFGEEAVRVNQAIVELAPNNDRAWTRLGRCLLEQRRFDEAIEALRTALSLNGANTVATNLLTEVRKRRAMTPTAAERATTGFTPREFAVLETHAPAH